MLLPNQVVNIHIVKCNIKYYKNLGYDCEYDTTIAVKVNDLPNSCAQKVDVKCDICGNVITRTYQEYNKHHTYNLDCCSNCAQIKNRITTLARYGVEHYAQTQECKEKSAATNLAKYGYEYNGQVPILNEKRINTRVGNGNAPISKPQKELHNIIQVQYPNAILNYPCERCIFDIAILLDKNTKIDIEYDSSYWHKNQQADRRRDEYFKSQGWKVLRVKSGHKIPSKKELFDALDYLINTEHHYKEIILDDWKLEENKSESA